MKKLILILCLVSYSAVSQQIINHRLVNTDSLNSLSGHGITVRDTLKVRNVPIMPTVNHQGEVGTSNFWWQLGRFDTLYGTVPKGGLKDTIDTKKRKDDSIDAVTGYTTLYQNSLKLEKSIEITYAQLATAITNSTLIIGRKYIITDYQSVHIIPYTTDVNTPTAEPLIVEAVSANTLSPIAYSTTHPEDIIYYHPDTNLTAVPGCTKGYISRRIDTKLANDIPLDFRSVVFRRWALDVPVWNNGTTYSKGAIVKSTANTNLYVSITDANLNNAVTDIDYWELFEWVNGDYVSPTPTAWIIGTNLSIPVSASYRDATMFQYSTNYYSNTIEGSGSNYLWNIILTCNNIFIGNKASKNRIGAFFYNNTIGANFLSNDIGMTCTNNSFGSGCAQTQLGSGCYNNAYNHEFHNNSIIKEAKNNIFGNHWHNNSTDEELTLNVFGENCYNNVIGQYFKGNVVKNTFNNNRIGTNFQSTIIGNQFSYNDIPGLPMRPDGIPSYTIPLDLSGISAAHDTTKSKIWSFSSTSASSMLITTIGTMAGVDSNRVTFLDKDNNFGAHTIASGITNITASGITSGIQALTLNITGLAQPATATLPATSFASIGARSATVGGLRIIGATNANGTNPLVIDAILGTTTPTSTLAALTLRGGKSDGSNNWGAVASTETVFKLQNYTTPVITVMGNGDATFTGTLAIGSGTAIAKVVSASRTYDCGLIAAGVDSTFSITCTGAVAGNPTSVGVSVAAEAGIVITAECTTNDAVTVRISNHFSVSAVDPASRAFKVMVANF